MGITLVPAFATLIPRLRMPEGKKYIQSQELNSPVSPASVLAHDDVITEETSANTAANHGAGHHTVDIHGHEVHTLANSPTRPSDIEKLVVLQTRKAKLDAFFVYFSEWRHLKVLIGTASCWFLLDVAFYGTNLNQSVLLQDIGYSVGTTKYNTLMKNTIGNLIIAASGYVPGYFFTVFLIEPLGRRWIQIQGFLICALMFGILAGGYTKIGTGGKFACFALAQVSPLFLISSTPYFSSSLTPISFSSTSAPTQQPLSSRRKSFPHEFVVSAMVSPLPSANSAPSCPLYYSTTSQDPRSSAFLTCYGSSSRAMCWVRLLPFSSFPRRRIEMRMSLIIRSGRRRMRLG